MYTYLLLTTTLLRENEVFICCCYEKMRFSYGVVTRKGGFYMMLLRENEVFNFFATYNTNFIDISVFVNFDLQS